METLLRLPRRNKLSPQISEPLSAAARVGPPHYMMTRKEANLSILSTGAYHATHRRMTAE
jgi:hypothetical protein